MERRTLLKLLAGGTGMSLLPAGLFARSASRPLAADPAGAAFAPEGASLNVGWRFQKGDIVPPPLKEQSATYVASKAGGARGAAAISYNDSDWRTLDLPHDWAMDQPPQQSQNIAQGYRERGIGWYRRTIALDPSLEGRYLEIQVGAASTNASVWLNGTPVAHNWSGYNSFYIDITSMALFGEKPNILAVRVDAESSEGWWYEGAGLYRDVRLVDRAPVSISTDGVHADPRKGADGTWSVPVSVTAYSIEKAPAAVSVVADLIDANGAVVASATGQGQVLPLEQGIVTATIADFQPRLWSVEEPNLYSVRTRLLRDGKVVDERTTPCGFRTIRFDGQHGFFLNDVPTKLKGVCLHQDHAGVGVAVPPALVEWRVRQIKAMGANAIRCSHGAPDVSLLDACDRLGVLVMDENRNFNISPDYVEQLSWLVRRDRNRPSIILWSVFNEEPFQGTPVGFEMVRRAASIVKELDDSRPVTAAMNSGMFTPVNVSQAVDVVGFNYQQQSYDRFHAENPSKPMLSSEDTSAFMTRGEWTTDKARKIAGSDDTQRAGWGLTQREAWKSIDTRPFMAGGFVWTGMDYHGEPTPHRWPANSSYFGIMDLCGFPKAAFYIRRALWIKDEPVLHIRPHWNWQGQEGKPVKVMLATNLDRVELWCNGKKVGEGKPDPYDMISFDVPYETGMLEARGWRGERMVQRDRVETTGAPVRLRLVADRAKLAGDGIDAQPIRIEALDARGRPVPTADLDVTLTITNGRIIGVGNGNPVSLAPSKGNQIKLFNGLAQAIVQTDRGSSGKLSLSASAPGVRQGGLLITVSPAEVRHSLPASLQQSVSMWRQSPVMAERPKVIPDLADNDMNSWDPVIAGERPAAASGNGYVILATKVTLAGDMSRSGATLRFAGITGSGEVLLNGSPAGRKAAAAPGPLEVVIPAGKTDVAVALVLATNAGDAVGLSGPVFLEAKR
ncbi:Glycosyl hydrolases family 2, sugar binding domain protein [Sphingobium herbicidovorans NBRC 16415]|uniref:Glycosyl hydrolases family 2, sugar binding domain protein n=1 Tax=Sphingobium herbicidovorans (strain ATCC 700291 / DSM 11019 / CCUG 56400 / KCTC 2939 / LMG 18315 / NBRC 16415 / MH) TaxID=1219045 RepID=A0A086P803_SPHHM|nr:beta-galactosidase GalA [Sphingobium herbicidovorans]KFG89521.1 Glycosyl hydrolases family 2, sugar binding domain protein [Sphingobium herbicidovorans NBRC 16415]